MVLQDYKNAQLEHAVDNAEQAILTAQQAERLIQQAANDANPQHIAHAEGNLRHAEHVVHSAIEDLKGTADEHREQIAVQALEQLEQAEQDIQAAKQVVSTPRQIR